MADSQDFFTMISVLSVSSYHLICEELLWMWSLWVMITDVTSWLGSSLSSSTALSQRWDPNSGLADAQWALLPAGEWRPLSLSEAGAFHRPPIQCDYTWQTCPHKYLPLKPPSQSGGTMTSSPVDQMSHPSDSRERSLHPTFGVVLDCRFALIYKTEDV